MKSFLKSWGVGGDRAKSLFLSLPCADLLARQLSVSQEESLIRNRPQQPHSSEMTHKQAALGGLWEGQHHLSKYKGQEEQGGGGGKKNKGGEGRRKRWEAVWWRTVHLPPSQQKSREQRKNHQSLRQGHKMSTLMPISSKPCIFIIKSRTSSTFYFIMCLYIFYIKMFPLKISRSVILYQIFETISWPCPVYWHSIPQWEKHKCIERALSSEFSILDSLSSSFPSWPNDLAKSLTFSKLLLPPTLKGTWHLFCLSHKAGKLQGITGRERIWETTALWPHGLVGSY